MESVAELGTDHRFIEPYCNVLATRPSFLSASLPDDNPSTDEDPLVWMMDFTFHPYDASFLCNI